MKVISIINQKGGVAKTTTAQALGAGLANKGYRILLLDLDPQGNLTYSTGAKANRGAYDLLKGSRVEECTTDLGELSIITSQPQLTGMETPHNALERALEPLQGYDYVIVDTPPALSSLTINALTASDQAIITAQADIYSLQGIGQLYQTIEAVKQRANPELTIAGILLTRHNPRTILGKELTDLMNSTAEQLKTKVYTSTIREAVAIREAQAMKADILTYAPNSKVANDYQAFIEEFMRDEKV